MATGFQVVRRSRLRDWLSGDAPASRGAQVFMFVSALLCGAALAGLLFVGVWRHTAGEAARSQAASLSDHRAVETSRRTVATLRARLAHEQELLVTAERTGARGKAALAQARSAFAQARAALARTQAADGAALRSLTQRLAGLSGAAGSLARATATLRSELAALETYAANPGPAGVDAGFLATQARYLLASATVAASAAADVVRRTDDLQAVSAKPAG